MKHSIHLLILLLLIISSCSSSEQMADGQIEVKKVYIVSDNPETNTTLLREYVHQLPGRQNGKKIHWALDSTLTARSCEDLKTALGNDGYLDAKVAAFVDSTKGAEVTYLLHPNEPYHLRNISYDIQDANLREAINYNDTRLIKGNRFSVAALNDERARITSQLQDNGYFRFNKDFIRYQADSVPGQHLIDLTLRLMPYKQSNSADPGPHPYYKVRSVAYMPAEGERIYLRKGVLDRCTSIHEGKPYSSSDVLDTYRRFARLQALRYSNIRFEEVGDSLLDCTIQLGANKRNTISFQPEGTNTSGNLGAAASITYENRNLFRGSEVLSLQMRGAFEAITGLEGYQNKNYEEYGAEMKLTFPQIIAPFLSNDYRRNHIGTSELSVSYNEQERPEFHRRVFSAAWRYRWQDSKKLRNWKLDLIDINYIRMPWISETFKHEYLDSEDTRNAILRYNYEDLFILKIGIGMTYSSGNNAYKWNVETAGNLLSGISHLTGQPKDDNGQYRVLNNAYAQYVKGDFDATHIFHLSSKSQVAIHGALGIAYPYGNSNVLPFEKRYFSGGANSVRGWSVRGLGPGRFRGTDGRIDFINQTGDIKLDLNAEFRTALFWKFSGAVFVDAGNIWTIREYTEQPGGQFRINEFYKQIAVAYGMGLRLNFGYFVLRFDMGMKAINPAYESSREHYSIIYPNLKRDFAFHFAVGLPF